VVVAGRSVFNGGHLENGCGRARGRIAGREHA
jgi:hypothetical protein